MAKKRTSSKVTPLTKTNQRKTSWILILIGILIFLFVFAQPVSEAVAPALQMGSARLSSIIEAVSLAIIFILVAVFFFILFTGWLGLIVGLLMAAAGLYLAQRALARPKSDWMPNPDEMQNQKAVI